jgi:pimeloyl-ACP methyl ester carboxylesterase
MIHALPGMGADKRMYPGAWSVLPDFVAHDWVRHSGEKSIAEIARSMADSCEIQDGDILIGSSLGGMVCCEIARIRRIRHLYLVGSAVHKSEISGLLSLLHPLAKVAPIDWVRFSSSSIPTEFTQMFAGIEASFVRSMCDAVFQWEGLGDTSTPVSRVHGRFDLVIPAPKHVDLLLNGGHLISISHAKQCADFVLKDVTDSDPT